MSIAMEDYRAMAKKKYEENMKNQNNSMQNQNNIQEQARETIMDNKRNAAYNKLNDLLDTENIEANDIANTSEYVYENPSYIQDPLNDDIRDKDQEYVREADEYYYGNLLNDERSEIRPTEETVNEKIVRAMSENLNLYLDLFSSVKKEDLEFAILSAKKNIIDTKVEEYHLTDGVIRDCIKEAVATYTPQPYHNAMEENYSDDACYGDNGWGSESDDDEASTGGDEEYN